MRRVVHFASAIGSAHTNTTTEGSIARYAFGVGELLPGRVIHWSVGARVSNVAPGDTLTMRVRFGTSATVTANTPILTGDAVTVAVDDGVVGSGEIHIQSTTRYVHLALVDNPHATGATRDTTGTCTVFTAVADTAYYLDITCDWNAASASDIVAAECWAVWEDEV
jgi:hypothetical protein